ncbi:hypothetical protein [Spirochaeta isovalerica]|uniref:Uncharacterized protein n=1 Tax=Spirochaeta isovalerica TaxID=150 RepID=A0A841R397_9SPIO|nr:hypothetical protein [Spirochaeta isovalerica]MBB6479524.1 hypothetical protein [Spirochaeta isovalerica]
MTEKALNSSETLESQSLSDTTWHELIDRMSVLFSLSDDMNQRFKKCKLAKLIAALPFIAGCDDPYRTALSHLSITYLASHEAGKDIFNHNFADNKALLKRLEPISHFSGGHKTIIDRGMNLLAVIMLADHKKDIENDKISDKYNPLSSEVWNFEKQIFHLEKAINSIYCPQMDEIITFEDAKAYWWEYPS